jgi:hypothetical protein
MRIILPFILGCCLTQVKAQTTLPLVDSIQFIDYSQFDDTILHSYTMFTHGAWTIKNGQLKKYEFYNCNTGCRQETNYKHGEVTKFWFDCKDEWAWSGPCFADETMPFLNP